MAIISVDRKKEVITLVLMLPLICMCCTILMSFIIEIHIFAILSKSYKHILLCHLCIGASCGCYLLLIRWMHCLKKCYRDIYDPKIST